MVALPPPPAVHRALVRAEHYWHAKPVCGYVTVRFGRFIPQAKNSIGYADVGQCLILLSSVNAWEPRSLCETVTHEYGHLLGYNHSRNPRSIMYPILTNKNLPKVCKRA